ncbi:Fe-S cluster assembly sulfur transfer protein SufU [Flavilitoribacter nigricans]|uniref:SUF system NifU family Fe-S cluster assembly protein n=1 Tax=Flavilitoribacter nigricans (strain ATCC 23147 / DSM 23189 / NBRC 102662 / NCIMB 1420 / SS-2) TaxID=1122177 RepID=A0A2D0N9N9_FLAN2|nr:SUF system NifU family Fe-S cluster assembly protein [Flavilitoribacter nigricans]PHN05090.1 SUF system NifU family Fe-S cluster assembly protein [Flavilitoribacter nigricans DSM 23189 = NBRC 102662]
MDQEELNKLYDDSILQENRQPYHYGKMPDADLTLEAYNPICGDQFKLFLYTDEDSIKTAYFHGYGCAVSKASTSVLTRELEGCTIEEAKAKCRDFLNWLSEGEGAKVNAPNSWESFAAVRDFPGRLSCAQLAWETIAKEL